MNAPIPPDVEERVQRVYQELHGRNHENTCIGRADCCRFALTGRTPFLTRGEALVAARAWRASGRRKVPRTPDGSCPFLKDGRCMIYSGRPFGCRTHFCKAAGGPMDRKSVRDLIHRLEAIDTALGGAGGVQFHAAIEWAMQETD